LAWQQENRRKEYLDSRITEPNYNFTGGELEARNILTAGEHSKEYFNSKRTEAWNALKVVEHNSKRKEYLESRRIEAENTGLKQENKKRMPCQQQKNTSKEYGQQENKQGTEVFWNTWRAQGQRPRCRLFRKGQLPTAQQQRRIIID
jgi:hypothetical protein